MDEFERTQRETRRIFALMGETPRGGRTEERDGDPLLAIAMYEMEKEHTKRDFQKKKIPSPPMVRSVLDPDTSGS
ncbi:hypothetical protein K8I61_17580 [bacterium]|nr:hypothetical protein [bacterium]